MKNNWILAISIVLAAVILAPSALALEVGFGGSPGSTTTKFSSSPGNSINVQNTISGDLLASAGALSGSGDGSLEQYFEWTSWDNKEKAAAFVYLADSDYWNYAFSGTSGKNSATANLKLTADVVEGGMFIGGFAYNPKDYAAVVLGGEGVEYLNYQNALSATSSKVSATQTFYGTDFDEVEAHAWAERGNLENELQTQTDVEDAWANPWMGPIFDWGANELFSSQSMYLDEGTIANSKKPYKATASLSSNTASSSQSVTLAGEEDDANVEFDNWAATGAYDFGVEGIEAGTDLEAYGISGMANNLVYSSQSKATSTQATASQTVAVKQADTINKGAWGSDFGNDIYADEWISVNRFTDTFVHGEYDVYDSGINSALSGTDSASAKSGYSSVTQKATASGAYISKDITAATNEEYYANARVDINDNFLISYYDPLEDTYYVDDLARNPATSSSLSGQSTATATLSSANVQSSGKWKATIAKDNSDVDGVLDDYEDIYEEVMLNEGGYASFFRVGEAANTDTFSQTELYKMTAAGSKTYSFVENEKATSSDATST